MTVHLLSNLGNICYQDTYPICIIMHAISHVLSACILMSVPSLSILRNMRYAPILCVRAEHEYRNSNRHKRGASSLGAAGRVSACAARASPDSGLLADFIVVVTRGAFTHPLRMV